MKILLTIISLISLVPSHYDSVNYTNDYRVANDLPRLQRIATKDIKERAEYLYNNKPISHDNWTDFIHIEYGEAGENICDKGYWKEKDFHIDTELHCIDAFKASPTHKEKVLGDYDTIAKGEYGDIIVYWYFKTKQ